MSLFVGSELHIGHVIISLWCSPLSEPSLNVAAKYQHLLPWLRLSTLFLI